MLKACKWGSNVCKTKWRSVGSQVAAGGGCESDVVHRLNEGFKAWGAMKSVLCYRGLGIKVKKCLYEGVINCTVGTITPLYRHFVAFIPNPLLRRTSSCLLVEKLRLVGRGNGV